MEAITMTNSKLGKEIRLLRSFVIGIAGRDKEGNYREDFVKKILKKAGKMPEFYFRDGRSFLSHIRGKK